MCQAGSAGARPGDAPAPTPGPGKGVVGHKLLTSPDNNGQRGAAAFSLSHKHRDRATVGLNKHVAIKQMFLAQRLSFLFFFFPNGEKKWFVGLLFTSFW